jgi:hypothetical protein
MKSTQNQFFGLDRDKHPLFIPGAIYIATDTKRIYVYDVEGRPKLVSGGSSGGGTQIIADTYSTLPSGEADDTIAFVLNSQGTVWLPGGLGGTYYPSGWYIYKNGNWTSIEVPVDQALDDYGDLISGNSQAIGDHILDTNNPHSVDKNDVGLSNVDNTSDLDKPISTSVSNALSDKSDVGHNHVKADITDFNDLDYATPSQGALADTALQPGDNISELFNDEVYLQPSDNVSALTNDANYITGNALASYRSDITESTIYSGYLLNSTPVIKKYIDGIETFATGVTDLETDWIDRLTLTYI